MILLLLACGLPQDRFQDRFQDKANEATCAWKADCYGEDYDACLQEAAQTTPPDMDGCTYDAVAARQCVHDLWRVPCPADGQEPTFPVACAGVWTCGS